jgi:hypothetical protein
MPTPEQVYFNNMSDKEQQARVLRWATMPVEWLTNFQIDKVGLKASPKMEKLATFVNQAETRLDYVVTANDVSYASNDYKALRAATDRSMAEKAQELGLLKEYAVMVAPTYKRVDATVGKQFANQSWNKMVQLADQANRVINAAAYGSIGDTKEAAYKYMVDQVNNAIKTDATFKRIMERFQVALAPSGKDIAAPDLTTLKLFFDYYDTKAPASLYV